VYNKYQNLKFFDKFGEQYQFYYDTTNFIWTGSIHLPRVSINIFENETIYVLEEIETSSSEQKFVLPSTENPLQPNFDISFLDIEDTISLFQISNDEISEIPKLSATVSSTPYTINNITNRKIQDSFIQETLRIDVCFKSSEENSYTRILKISDGVNDIALIEIYAESIGEDERFSSWLSNFGKVISHEDYKIFRTTDIDEPFVDYNILNAKRKELLVELKNIFQYSNSYKGLVNVIKYFGYYDIRLKELFYNSDTQKYLYDEVKLFETDNLEQQNKFDIKPFNKTSFFALFYDIVKIKKDEYFENGLPVTEKAYQYTQEEVLLKLYNLKQYIDVNDIGGIANISDIIGEFVVFNKYSYKNWINKYQIKDIESGDFAKFSINQNFGYIEDMRNLINPHQEYSIARDWTAISNPTETISPNSNAYIGYFEEFNRDSIDFIDGDDIPIGFNLVLENQSFDFSWSDSSITWQESVYQNILITWGNYSSLLVNDIEWVIKYVKGQDHNLNPNLSFIHRKYLPKDILEYSVILPYQGYYDITLILHCFNGEKTTKTIKNAVFVDMKNADSISFFRIYDFELQYFNSNNENWSDIHNQWKSNIFNTEKYSIQDSEISYRSLLAQEWVYLNKFQNVSVGIQDVKWDSYKNTIYWSDLKYTTFDYLIYKRERLAKFDINSIESDIQINSDIISTEGFNEAELTKFSQNYNESNPLNPFYFTAREMSNPSYIDAVSTNHDSISRIFIGSSSDSITSDSFYQKWSDFNMRWSEMPINFGNSAFVWESKFKHNMFTMDDLYYHNDKFDAPIFTNVFFVNDNSKIAGKTKTVWKLIKEDVSENVIEVTSKNFSYRFISSGQYSLEMSIIDNRGNYQTRYRKNLINIVPSESYKYVR